jgi:hypothetical protein
MKTVSTTSLGIDFSAASKKTVGCEIDWSGRQIRFFQNVDESKIQSWAKDDEHDVVSVDVPFGWPEPFLEVMSLHRDGRAGPANDSYYESLSQKLRYRTTDEFVRRHARNPLSVSTDRIGCSALRFALIQAGLERQGLPIDRAGLRGKFVEVYPAASLDIWWEAPAKNKEYAGRVFAWLEEQFEGRLTIPKTPDLQQSDDAADALICALMARAVQLSRLSRNDSLVQRPDTYWSQYPGTEASIRREGWIWLPNEPTLRSLLA